MEATRQRLGQSVEQPATEIEDLALDNSSQDEETDEMLWQQDSDVGIDNNSQGIKDDVLEAASFFIANIKASSVPYSSVQQIIC